MKKLRWPILIVLLALAAIAVLLLSQQTVLLPVVSEEIKPATGGSYSEGIVGSLSRLNPVLDLYNPGDRDIDRLIFSGLVQFDDRGLPQPDLAESWGVSQDGKVYNFSIRSNAVWHDGKPVTSDDILFTIGMMRDEKSIVPADVKKLWKDVEVKRLDDKTLQFRLPEPFAPFLDYLSFGVLPKHLLGSLSPDKLVGDPFNLKPVGSGPYQFNHLITDNGQITGVALSAFKDYYGQKAFIQQFVFRYYPDPQAELDAYKNGEIKGIGNVTPDILSKVLQESQLNVHTGRLPEMTLIYLNLDSPQVPFFADASIRKALLQGINRQWIADHLLQGQAILADGPIFPGTWAYYDGIQHIDYDPENAVELLKKAGYTIPAEGGNVRADKDNKKLEFDLSFPDDAKHAALAEAIQKDWSRLGVGVTIKPLPYDQLVNEELGNRTYQAALVDLNLEHTPDPDPYPFWHQTQITGGQNYAKWNDFQASEYLEQARVVLSLSDRTKEYRNFQVRFSEELPALPLFFPVYTYAIDSEVQGVRMGPLFDPSDRFATVTGWYLVAKRTNTQTETPAPATPGAKP